MPGNIYLKDLGLQGPEDIFIINSSIYVADTGNSRVLIYNIKNGERRILGEGTLSSPCGIFVTDDLNVYVADKVAKAVFIFDDSGTLKKTIGRPDNYLFSELSEYTPKNVVVTDEGNIYVCGESAYEGLMQFSPEGEFEGYFAANRKHLTFTETLEDMLLSEKMKQNSLMRRPRTIFNLDINNRNLIYTVTQTNEYDTETQTHLAKEENCIKQFNLAGVNIMSANNFMDDAWNFVDVASGDYGNVYAVTNTGLIYEYDKEGNVIFSFGGRAVSSDRNGLFTYAAAIDTDENGFVYVLDREKGFVEVFYPTNFAIMTHQAIYDLENGDYKAAEASWGAVLKLNGMARNAHIGYGKTLLHQQRYNEAMRQFRLAGDREYYSEAFWQLRDDWLNEHMIYILLLIIAFVIYVIISSLIKRKKPIVKTSYLKKIPTTPAARFAHDIGYVGYMLKHPIDGYYYLKRGEAGSLLSTGILYFVIFAVYIADSMLRGYANNQYGYYVETSGKGMTKILLPKGWHSINIVKGSVEQASATLFSSSNPVSLVENNTLEVFESESIIETSKIKVMWATGFADSYDIECSLDGESWSSIKEESSEYTVTNGAGSVDTVDCDNIYAKYFRIVPQENGDSGEPAVNAIEIYGKTGSEIYAVKEDINIWENFSENSYDIPFETAYTDFSKEMPYQGRLIIASFMIAVVFAGEAILIINSRRKRLH